MIFILLFRIVHYINRFRDFPNHHHQYKLLFGLLSPSFHSYSIFFISFLFLLLFVLKLSYFGLSLFYLKNHSFLYQI